MRKYAAAALKLQLIAQEKARERLAGSSSCFARAMYEGSWEAGVELDHINIDGFKLTSFRMSCLRRILARDPRLIIESLNHRR